MANRNSEFISRHLLNLLVLRTKLVLSYKLQKTGIQAFWPFHNHTDIV